MDLMGLIEAGLIAAVPVAIACIVFILVRSDAIDSEVDKGMKVLGFSGHNKMSWIASWTVIAFVFGIFASWVYSYTMTTWNWGPIQYLALALVLAVGLTVLGVLRIYNGKQHPFRYEWIGLNFAFAIGFGILVPILVV